MPQKNPSANARDAGLIPEWGRFPGEGNGYPHQYSCLGNPWTEESGELHSWGHRVRHDLETKIATIVVERSNKNIFIY